MSNIFNSFLTSGQDVANPNGPNLGEVVSKLIGSVQDLQSRVAAHEELLQRLNTLEKENNQLRSTLENQNQEILRLRGLLSVPAAASTSSNNISNTAPGKSRDSDFAKDTPK